MHPFAHIGAGIVETLEKLKSVRREKERNLSPFEIINWAFPGHPVVKTLSFNAEDIDLVRIRIHSCVAKERQRS